MLDLLNLKMTEPTPFGLFHILFFIIFLILNIVLLSNCNCSDKKFRRTVLIAWIIIIVFELLKQINRNYDFENNCFKNTYDWTAFPFQLCSLPFYTWPITIFFKDSKIRDLFNIFNSTILFFGGFAYYFVPVSFCEYVIINIQTLVHHGLQFSIGLFIFYHEYKKMEMRSVLQSLVILFVSVIIAVSLNAFITGMLKQDTNLFELNPIKHTTVVFFGDVCRLIGYIPFLFSYTIGLSIYGVLIYLLLKNIPMLYSKINNKIFKKRI